MGRFWIPDVFIMKYAKYLKSSAHSVYMSLCSHANREGITFISYQRIANDLGFSKTTVSNAVNELIAYQLLVRLTKKTGRASHLKVLSVPKNNTKPYQNLGSKKYNKELFKEEKRFYKKSEPESIGNIIRHKSRAYRELEKRWGKKRL